MLKNKRKSIFVAIILMNIYNVSRAHSNIFHDLNEELQSITNELFSTLGLKQNFHAYENIQYMLNTHKQLRNISETNIEIYNIMKNVQDTQEGETDALFKIKQVLNELDYNNSYLTNETFFGDIQKAIDNKIEKIILATVPKNRTTMNVSKDREKSNEENSGSKEIISSSDSMSFVDEFLKKVDNLTINDFMKEESDTSLKETRRFGKNRYYDLKIWRDVPTRRLFKGVATGIIEYPFIVSVHVNEEFNCAGNIISKTFILTSASCLQTVYKNRLTPSNLPNVSARIGSDFISKYGELIPIVTIFFHPKYNPTYLKNNIAILRMEKHTYFRRNRNIRRIDFDDKKRKILDDSHQITLLGWGSKYTNQKVNIHEPLSYTDLNIFNHKMCKKIYSGDYVTATNFCAGFIFKGDGACSKDNGGPAIVEGVLVGVVSFAPMTCGVPNSPTVFTKISCYNQWIRGIINDDDVSIKLNHTADEVTLGRINDTQNINIEEYDNQNNFNKSPPKVSQYKRGLNNTEERSNLRLPSRAPYGNDLQDSSKNKKLLTIKSDKTKADSRNYYKTTIELPNNYNFYSFESDDTDEDGLSIEISNEYSLKPKTSSTKEKKFITHYNRNTDLEKKKVIEEHFINILENILKISTKKQFQDFLRHVKGPLKKTTLVIQSYNNRPRDRISIKNKKGKEKLTTSHHNNMEALKHNTQKKY